MPTTRARTEPRRPCGKSSDKSALPRERRELEATVFFLLRELDSLVVSDCALALVWPADFVSASEESCATAPGEPAGEAPTTAACAWAFDVCVC